MEAPVRIEAVRTANSTFEVISGYLDQVKDMTEKNNYIKELIINMDETWLNPQKSGKTCNVVTRLDIPVAPVREVRREPPHITICVAATASGSVLTPFAIINIKKIPSHWLMPSRTDWRYEYAESENGWANQVDFCDFDS